MNKIMALRPTKKPYELANKKNVILREMHFFNIKGKRQVCLFRFQLKSNQLLISLLNN